VGFAQRPSGFQRDTAYDAEHICAISFSDFEGELDGHVLTTGVFIDSTGDTRRHFIFSGLCQL
jgi:hypothetical protein